LEGQAGHSDLAGCAEEQLWRHVASHLERRGNPVVLVGGAVVVVYWAGAYRSGDLDLVRQEIFGSGDLDAVMSEIGFKRHGRHYEHLECAHLYVDFVAGPLGVGGDSRIIPDETAGAGVMIKLLSPTDCVRARLATYIHSHARTHARECLDRAVLVAGARTIDRDLVRRWCDGEDPRGPAAYADLRRLARDCA